MRNAALQPCVCLGTLALAVLCFPDAREAIERALQQALEASARLETRTTP